MPKKERACARVVRAPGVGLAEVALLLGLVSARSGTLSTRPAKHDIGLPCRYSRRVAKMWRCYVYKSRLRRRRTAAASSTRSIPHPRLLDFLSTTTPSRLSTWASSSPPFSAPSYTARSPPPSRWATSPHPRLLRRASQRLRRARAAARPPAPRSHSRVMTLTTGCGTRRRQRTRSLNVARSERTSWARRTSPSTGRTRTSWLPRRQIKARCELPLLRRAGANLTSIRIVATPSGLLA